MHQRLRKTAKPHNEIILNGTKAARILRHQPVLSVIEIGNTAIAAVTAQKIRISRIAEGLISPSVLPRVERAQTLALFVYVNDPVHLARNTDHRGVSRNQGIQNFRRKTNDFGNRLYFFPIGGTDQKSIAVLCDRTLQFPRFHIDRHTAYAGRSDINSDCLHIILLSINISRIICKRTPDNYAPRPFLRLCKYAPLLYKINSEL